MLLKIKNTFLLLIFACSLVNGQKHKMNVLFIAIDDLRPTLGAYGDSFAVTPNFDSLASKGVVFSNAYCQQAVCAPSRNSILTGLRPDSLKIYDLGTNFRSTCPDVVTLPQHFKNNGYHSESIGKIYHIWHGNHDDTASWTKPPWNPWDENLDITPVNRNDTFNLHTSRPIFQGKPIAWNASEFPEQYEQDSRITQHAINRIKALKDSSFFLGIGYLKPHLPFNAPRRFWDKYDSNDFVMPDTSSPQFAPSIAMSDDGELKCCYPTFDTISFPLNEHYTRNMIHGYYACVSFIDYQLGQLIKTLDELSLAENTLIVLWGDHGYKLGEYGHWCKHSNYDTDIRVPLIVYNPSKETHAHHDSTIVELLDLYPTICEEASLNAPLHLQGRSLTKLIDNSEKRTDAYALSQWPKQDLMGYSLRYQHYHYIAWFKKDSFVMVEEELYDLSVDPGEKKSLIYEQSYTEHKEALHDKLLSLIAKD